MSKFALIGQFLKIKPSSSLQKNIFVYKILTFLLREKQQGRRPQQQKSNEPQTNISPLGFRNTNPLAK